MISKAERWLLPVAGLAWLLLMPVLTVAKPRQGTVLSIGDGGTLRVKQGGKTITVRLDVTTTDRYGRIVAEVIGGINLGLALVDTIRGRTAGRSASSTESIPGARMVRCGEIGSLPRAQELLRQNHTFLDSNGDGEACDNLR